MKHITCFQELDAWKKGHEIVLLVYRITKQFPKEELFCLTNQMRRAAISVTSNIAEGFGRNSAKDKCNFYVIAKGSLFELQSQLSIAKDIGYLEDIYYAEIDAHIVQNIRLLAGLMRTASDRPHTHTNTVY